MKSLWATKGPQEPPKAKTVRALRDAVEALGYTRISVTEAFGLYEYLVAEGDLFLGVGDEPTATRAGAMLTDVGLGYRIEDADEDDLPPDAAYPEDAAAKAAMVLLHALDGNPNYALQIAKAFGRVTGDEVWDEVARLVLEAFPPRPTG